MDILNFISESFIILVVVCYVIGMALKKAGFMPDKYIPITLIVVGAILGGIFALQTEVTLFMGIMQGLLCGGASTGINQAVKQANK